MTCPIIIKDGRIAVQTITVKPSGTVTKNTIHSHMTKYGLLFPTSFNDSILFDYVENGHLRLPKENEAAVAGILFGINRTIHEIALSIFRQPPGDPAYKRMYSTTKRVLYHEHLEYVRGDTGQEEIAMVTAVKLTSTIEEAIALYGKVMPMTTEGYNFITFEELDKMLPYYGVKNEYTVNSNAEHKVPRLVDRDDHKWPS